MLVQNCKINGKIDAKPSKSIFQRLLALAMLSSKPTVIENICESDDCQAVLKMLVDLGIIVHKNENYLEIQPASIKNSAKLYSKESGLAIRMFSAILSIFPYTFTIYPNGSMLSRKLFEIEKTLTSLGANVQTNFDLPPIVIKGPIKSGEIQLDASQSSQFLTGLLIALPKLSEKSTINVVSLSSKPYVDITIDLISKFGGKVENREYKQFICYPSEYTGGEFYCENDWSNSSVFLIAGAIGGKCSITGLNLNSFQGDRIILNVLEEVGARIEFCENTIEVVKNNLQPFEFDAQNNPDLVPYLSVLAMNCQGTSKIYNIERLKYKESNRLAKILEILESAGVEYNFNDGLLQISGGNYSIDFVDTSNDHRIAMVAALLSINNPHPIEVKDPYSVNKSYPDFWNDFRKIQLC